MRFGSLLPAALLLSSVALGACTASTGEDASAGDDAITSYDAKILDFTFDAEVIADRDVDARKAIVSQLMYVQGILTTADNGNGQVGNVKLVNVRETPSGDTKRIAYKASLPVAWPKGLAVPKSYDLPLPRDASRFDRFDAKYDGRCGEREYEPETFWHDYNPKAPGCTVQDADVWRSVATVTLHAKETKNKYPEYDQMWKDDRLDVVAIFGIIESDKPDDYGYTEAKTFADESRRSLTAARVTENSTSRSILKDTTITGKAMVAGRERDVKIDVLIVHTLEEVGGDFDARYDALSEKADMILYNGHAGLGKNVNALARKGRVAAGKYQLVLLNGCQSFAYIDTTLTDRRRQANGASDPDGTKFLDVIGNALPGWEGNLANMSNELYRAAIRPDKPKSYSEIMSAMPESNIIVVFGEEDNAFHP